jgi:hypothetical protein
VGELVSDTAVRLVGPGLLSNAAATKYTVPASTTTIIRHIIICNTTGLAATFTLSIGADAAGTELYTAVPIAANTTIETTGFIVLAAAEIIQAFSGTNNALSLTISGVETT